jgi:hypothetical protein
MSIAIGDRFRDGETQAGDRIQAEAEAHRVTRQLDIRAVTAH